MHSKTSKAFDRPDKLKVVFPNKKKAKRIISLSLVYENDNYLTYLPQNWLGN